jgi:hypothetical protein
METGFLGAENWPVGLQWYRKETETGFTIGEPVATDRTLQMEYMRGERCTRCRVMLLAY